MLTTYRDCTLLAFKYIVPQFISMQKEIFDICNFKKKEVEYKRKLDKSYYRLEVISLILDKVPPIIFDVIKLIKLYNKPQKFWQDILHLKKSL